MAERTQNYQNHARTYPLYHWVASPILGVNFLNTLRHIYLEPSRHTVWEAIVAFGLVALTLSARVMAITVQDRLIRLEMQLRLARVLPANLQAAVASLTPKQFTALRFAGDGELPELVREISDGRLQKPKDIKQRVKDWQPDWLRA